MATSKNAEKIAAKFILDNGLDPDLLPCLATLLDKISYMTSHECRGRAIANPTHPTWYIPFNLDGISDLNDDSGKPIA